MLIYSRNLAPELACLNVAVASLCLAWNISRKRESELSNHELLDVLSEVVIKLSGHDTWNSSTPYNIPFKQCSKWYFIKGVRLLSIYCERTLCCILSLGENVQTIFQVSTQHSQTNTVNRYMTRVMSICQPCIMYQERIKKKLPNTF